MKWLPQCERPERYLEANVQGFCRVLVAADKMMIAELRAHVMKRMEYYIQITVTIATGHGSEYRESCDEDWSSTETSSSSDQTDEVVGVEEIDAQRSSKELSEQLLLAQERVEEAREEHQALLRRKFDRQLSECLHHILLLPDHLQKRCSDVLLELLTGRRGEDWLTDPIEILELQQVQEYARADAEFGLAMARPFVKMCPVHCPDCPCSSCNLD